MQLCRSFHSLCLRSATFQLPPVRINTVQQDPHCFRQSLLHNSSVRKSHSHAVLFTQHGQHRHKLHRRHLSTTTFISTSEITEKLTFPTLTSKDDAAKIVANMRQKEKTLLREALQIEINAAEDSSASKPAALTRAQIRHVFLYTSIPFVGFGLVDNLIMLVAGEYIDNTLGVMLGISTLAAAGLGNILSDVAGVGLAHYIELFAARIGLGLPPLTSAQWNSGGVRFVSNLGRALGLVIGCFLGMMPLWFFNEAEKLEKKLHLHHEEKENT